MLFFTRNYLYDDDIGINATNHEGDNSIQNAIDGDKRTYYECASDATISIDLKQNQYIDSCHIRADNVDAISLYYSDNGSNYTLLSSDFIDKGEGVYWLFGAIEQNKRYWRIVIEKGAGNIRIYEIFLMKMRLNQSLEQYRPSSVKVTFVDTKGGKYLMADGSMLSYSGIREYAKIELSYTFTPMVNYNSIKDLYTIPSLRSPLCILPDENYPNGIYRVVWSIDELDFEYSSSYTGSGFSGKLVFEEW